MGPNRPFCSPEYLFKTLPGIYLAHPGTAKLQGVGDCAFAAHDIGIMVWFPRQCRFGSNFELYDNIWPEAGCFVEQSLFAPGGPIKAAAALQPWAVADGLELTLRVAVKQNDTSAISK